MSSAPASTALRPVRVLLFASLAEAFGASSIDLPLPEGATAGELLARVMADPRAAPLRGRVRVAIAHRFADADEPVGPGDEVALIPPVAGG